MMDIINNIIQMGINDIKFILGNKAIDRLGNIMSDTKYNSWIESMKDIIKDFQGTLDSMMDIDVTSIDSTTDLMKDMKDKIKDVIGNSINAVLLRYRWPLRGSIGVVTGLHTTPWHITIGNPLNPILSMANVTVEEGKIKMNKELTFNDLPTKINVSFDVSSSRPMGKQEIIEVLNISYKREYSSINNTGISGTINSTDFTSHNSTSGGVVSRDIKDISGNIVSNVKPIGPP
jgi:hypothetical protein